MQTFDPQYGLVEYGTPGVHGGAVVVDLDAEIKVLRKLAAQSYQDGYWWPRMPRAMRFQRVEESNRHHVDQLEVMRAVQMHSLGGHYASGRSASRSVVTHKLALLAPYVEVIRAGELKRRLRTPPTRFIVSAMLPARVEQINITVNLEADHADL